MFSAVHKKQFWMVFALVNYVILIKILDDSPLNWPLPADLHAWFSNQSTGVENLCSDKYNYGEEK